MLPQAATLYTSQKSDDRRASPRRSLEFGFDTGPSSTRTRVVILDISKTGLRLQSSTHFNIGDKIQLELPETDTLGSSIVWTDGDQYGVKFERPIPQAAVSAVILGAPAFPPGEGTPKLNRLRERPPVQPAPNWLVYTMVALTSAAVVAFIYVLLNLMPIGI
ncbi:PilZ domain-containing protein [Altererythrobacter sp. H2]|uniref:PilZ domain-containing protein n=1 Tax=Altererythrobacter sp. H2 TaxID=3108391 RepID=UPI002B4BD752|nr:PilZ domain-containing protein [Altererythrobacter sp. H2]WRK97357.1 PilZ domain-containing protein [Altererythrobacter sp. H2]